MQRIYRRWRFVVVLWLAGFVCSGCSTPAAQEEAPAGLYARVTMPANPIRLEPSRAAPYIGLAFHGMRFPITGKMSNCEWLQIELPPALQHFGVEGWIIGPPEFALIDGGGCADIPDLTPLPTPAG